MNILTVTGYKGGVAKSTTAVHLATYFSDLGSTVLVDGDANRTALNWASRGSLPFRVADERQAVRLVSGADYVVIDTPARPHSDDLSELAKGCDLLVLPTTPDVVSLQPMLETARDLGDANYRALLVIVPPYPSREGELMHTDLIKEGVPVFKAMIRRTVGFPKAALAGVPIRNLMDKSALGAWGDYQAVGDEIMELWR
ncbi:MAG: ParA family protein [Merismopedia sp. SIO2A8]|nr:ParA family protein [Symploca sp. SIO2B6]NET47422.1 ParA family protein [Merismopedia sp. SIO2A8]